MSRTERGENWAQSAISVFAEEQVGRTLGRGLAGEARTDRNGTLTTTSRASSCADHIFVRAGLQW